MMFIQIPRDFILEHATNNTHTPTLYSYENKLVRDFFWMRPRKIYNLYTKFIHNKNNCLDFGCGGGIFLPTLSQSFKKVVGYDIELREANEVVKHYQLENVTLEHKNIYEDNLGNEIFDAIFALDVLEHLCDLNIPIQKLHIALKSDGLLFTSLPTENFTTKLTRFFGNFDKPYDHYHTGYEVENFLNQNGFNRIYHQHLIPIFPMYLISVWKKTT